MSKRGANQVSVVYGAKIEKNQEGRFEVSFRDVAGALSYGETFEEAVFNASEALDGVLAVALETGTEIPAPTPVKVGEVAIPVGLSVAAPVMLYLTRQSAGMTMAQVARAMEVSYQRYQQLEQPGGNLTMKTLQAAASAMGAMVELRVTPINRLKTI